MERHSKFLVGALLDYQRQSLYCDTAIVTANGTVFAHSAVLAAACPCLSDALNKKPYSAYTTNVIDLSGYDIDLVQRMVEFFYVGRLPTGRVAELKLLCEQLGVILQMTDQTDDDRLNADLNDASHSDNKLRPPSMQLNKSGGPHLCIVCLRRFSETVTFKEHKQLHENGTISTYAFCCNLCQGIFDGADALRLHCSAKHDGLTYPCICCNRTFGNYAIFQAHVCHVIDAAMTQSLFDRSNDWDSSFAADDIKHSGSAGFNTSDVSTGRFRCSHCAKMFATGTKLKRHVDGVHTSNDLKPYKCLTCGKGYAENFDLKKHVARCQPASAQDMSAVTTSGCGNSSRLEENEKNEDSSSNSTAFTDKSDTSAIIANTSFEVMSVDQKFPRTVTGDDASTRKTARRVQNTKMFTCPVCMKKCVSALAMRSHQCGAKDSAKAFQCEQCPRSFGAKKQLLLHMNLHDGRFKCDVCQAPFRRDAELRDHMHTHNGKRPHRCLTCNASYNNRDSLRKHVRLQGHKPQLAPRYAAVRNM